MRLSTKLIENLEKLLQGDTLPFSSLPPDWSSSLVSEGLLTVRYHGTRRRVVAGNTEALRVALPRYNETLCDLKRAKELLTSDNSRSAQAALSGNSKTSSQRSCPGFLVNTYDGLRCSLNGNPFTINPVEGSATYVADWKYFSLPTNVLIIGIENMENFFRIREQEQLFASFLMPDETDILFVARYALSNDLMNWLKECPNRYLHFGDFDLAGIHIFETQFKPYVGNRGSFLIPEDIEQRLSQGSRERYNDQYTKYSHLKSDDPSIQQLIDLINKFRRSYDQEGYILNPTFDNFNE